MNLFSKAAELGIQTEFFDGQGHRHTTDAAALQIIIDAMPVRAPHRFLTGPVVVRLGQNTRTQLTDAATFPLHWKITLESKLIAETQGFDTASSAERVAVIMNANRMHSCVAVSDAYHVFRIRKLLEHEGVQVYVAPRPDSRPRSAWQRVIAVLREAASYMVWKLNIPA